MSKSVVYGLVVLDVLAALMITSFASCLGGIGEECSKSLGSPITWLVMLVAGIANGVYIYKRRKAGRPALPFEINLLHRPDVPWLYFPYYFLALILWGENVPEIAGYLKGLPLGAPGTHASLMNPALFFQGNSGTTLNLITFAMMAFVFTLLWRKLNFVVALLGSNAIGTSIEYVTKIGKPQDGPEGFDIYNRFWGTMLTFVWLWTLLTVLPYLIFKLVYKSWRTTGVWVLIVFMLLLNIASYFFFRYEMYVLKNVQPGFLGESFDTLPDMTCPDQVVMDKGKPFAYKNGKGVFIKDQNNVDWIKANCQQVEL